MTLAEAATIAGVIPVAVGAVAVQQSGALQGAAQRRAAGDGRRRLHHRATPPSARRTSRSSSSSARSKPRRRTSSTYVGQTLDRRVSRPDDDDDAGGRRLHDARSAPAAARAGRGARRPDARRRAAGAAQAQGQSGSGADRRRSAHRRDPRVRRRPLVQPVAVQPRDRLAAAAGLGVQAVRVSHRVRAGGRTRAAPTSRRPRSSTTSRRRSSSTIRSWTPENYENEYDGPITFRRALAHSRNLGDDPSRAERPATTTSPHFWKRLGVGNAPKPYPSIALGVFEATPYRDRDRLHAVSRTAARSGRCSTSAADHQRRQGRDEEAATAARRDVARPDTTFLVTNMMRSVLNEGTGGQRARGTASRSTPPARPARPTICAMPGSSASRPSC